MPLTSAELVTALNVTGTDVAVATLPVFEAGDVVYVRAEYATAGQGTFRQRPLRVLEIVIKTDGTIGVLDKNGAAADGTQSANVATDNSSNDTHVKYPWFYRCQDIGSGEIATYHESELLDIDGVNSVRDANNWTNPA